MAPPPLLGQAKIVIDQATLDPGIAGRARNDGVVGELVTLRNEDNTNVLKHRWFLARPRASSATLSSLKSATTQFEPDVDGTYIVTLEVNEGKGRLQRHINLFAIQTTGGYRYPGQGETSEANWASTWTAMPNETGYWEDMDKILRANQEYMDASLVTVEAEALGSSRRLSAGAGITLVDGGPGSTIEIKTSLVAGVKALLDVAAQSENLLAVRAFKAPTRDATKYGQVNLGSEVAGAKGTKGHYAVIIGGLDNLASADHAIIVGGDGNTASAINTFIGGGAGNTATETYAVVVAGSANDSSGAASIVGAGSSNTCSGDNAGVLAGTTNDASGNASSIVGGDGNTCAGLKSFVGGGYRNNCSDDFSVVVGGYENELGSSYSFIGGGQGNATNATTSTIAGGLANVTNGSFAAVLGGRGNEATGDYSAIAGGQFGSAGLNAFVGSGSSNDATGDYSVIAGGSGNLASGSYSSAGGRNSTASADDAHALGRSATASHAGSIVIKDGSVAAVASSAIDEVTLSGAGGIRVFFPGAKMRRSGFSTVDNYDDVFHGSATTTNAVAGQTIIATIPTGQDVHVRAVLKGKKVSDDDFIIRYYEAAYINNGGAITVVGPKENSTANASGGNLYSATCGVTGTSFAVNYTGVAATTVYWTWKVEWFVGGAP